MLLALISLLNSTLSYFGIDIVLFSYIGCTSFLSLSFIYLASYCFGFCAYHRMFLNYVVVNDLLSIYDYYKGKLPAGQKVAGFKELFWYKKDLDAYLKVNKHGNKENN